MIRRRSKRNGIGQDACARRFRSDLNAPLEATSSWLSQQESIDYQKKMRLVALVLGVLSIVAALSIGFGGFRLAVKSTECHYQNFYLDKARLLAELASLMPSASHDSLLSNIERAWRSDTIRPADEYICIVDKDSRLILHTANPHTVGNFAGENLVLGNDRQQACLLQNLVENQEEYAGGYTSSAGQEQVVAFVPIPERGWTLGLHRGRDALSKEVRTNMQSLTIGFLLVCGVLMPSALLLMLGIASSSLGNQRRVQVALAEVNQELERSNTFLNAAGRTAKVGGWELDAESLELRWTEGTKRIHEVSDD